MAGRGAYRDRARRRLRVPGPEVQVAVGHRPGDYRDALERAALLGRAQLPERQVKAPVRKVRCAIYTRVSTDERLDMEFNSLEAQREAWLTFRARSMKAGSSSATAST